MLTQSGADVLLFVVVKPNRPKSAILGVRVGPGRASTEMVTELEIALGAPPVDGAANAELVAVLAKTLRLPKRHVELESGQASRHKVVRLRGVTLLETRSSLEAAGVLLPSASGA